jgi:hypothetical protein
MSPRADNRRRRSLLAAIVADPYRKLLAIVLAISLWYFLDSQVTKTDTFSLDLQCIDFSDRGILEKNYESKLLVRIPKTKVFPREWVNPANNQVITRVSLRVRGPKYQIENLNRSAHVFTAGPFEGVDWSQVKSYNLTAADLQRDRSLQDVAFELDPPRIQVTFEQVETQSVTLKLDLVDYNASSVDRADLDRAKDSARFNPPTVSLTGPRSMLDEVHKSGKLFKCMLVPSEDGRTLAGPLVLNTEYEDKLRLEDKDAVTLTFRVQLKSKRYTFEIPLSVDDRSLPTDLQGLYQVKRTGPGNGDEGKRPITRSVDVMVSGDVESQLAAQETVEARANWAARYFRLLVWIPYSESNTYPPTLTERAVLELRGDQFQQVDHANYRLVNVEAVDLEKTTKR